MNNKQKLTFKEWINYIKKQINTNNEFKISKFGKFYISDYSIKERKTKLNNRIFNIQPKIVKTLRFKTFKSYKNQVNSFPDF